MAHWGHPRVGQGFVCLVSLLCNCPGRVTDLFSQMNKQKSRCPHWPEFGKFGVLSVHWRGVPGGSCDTTALAGMAGGGFGSHLQPSHSTFPLGVRTPCCSSWSGRTLLSPRPSPQHVKLRNTPLLSRSGDAQHNCEGCHVAPAMGTCLLPIGGLLALQEFRRC